MKKKKKIRLNHDNKIIIKMKKFKLFRILIKMIKQKTLKLIVIYKIGK